MIDHKIFPGKRTEWEAKALSYSGQLKLYREVTGATAVAIHLVTTGTLLFLDFDAP